jgi:hypothetical protein
MGSTPPLPVENGIPIVWADQPFPDVELALANWLLHCDAFVGADGEPVPWLLARSLPVLLPASKAEFRAAVGAEWADVADVVDRVTYDRMILGGAVIALEEQVRAGRQFKSAPEQFRPRKLAQALLHRATVAGLDGRLEDERRESEQAAGRIPSFKLPTGPVRFRLSEVEAWLEGCRRGPAPDGGGRMVSA